MGPIPWGRGRRRETDPKRPLSERALDALLQQELTSAKGADFHVLQGSDDEFRSTV